MIRVVIADDHELIRAGFRTLLGAAPDVEVVGEAATGQEVVAQVRQTRPDVVLMDIRMPDGDGIEATRTICGDGDARVIILTTFELQEHVFAAIRAGASGFLGKGVDPAQLLAAVRVVARGESLLSSRATVQLLETVRGIPDDHLAPVADLSVLTVRERQVTELVAMGLSNQEIAQRLFLSPLTVKSHVSRSMTKADARDRAQLVSWYYQGQR